MGCGYVPEHWTWGVRPGGAGAGGAHRHRRRAVRRRERASTTSSGPVANRAWSFDACGDDPVIEEVRVMLDLLDFNIRVILLTARPQRFDELTEAWLRRYQIRWDVLIMRPWGLTRAARGTSSSHRSGIFATTGSRCCSGSRTTAATWRCCGRRASRCSTGTSGYYRRVLRRSFGPAGNGAPSGHSLRQPRLGRFAPIVFGTRSVATGRRVPDSDRR